MSEMGLVPVQVLSFLWAVALGAGLGLLYDCFRIVRLAFPSPTALVAVQDIVFGLLASAISFSYLLTVSDGKLRFFLFLGEAVGWALYYATVGDIVMALSSMIIAAISAVLRFLWRIARAVLLFIWRIIAAVIRFVSGIFIRPAKAVWHWSKKRLRAVLLRTKNKAHVVKAAIRARLTPPAPPPEEKNLKTRIKPKMFLQ